MRTALVLAMGVLVFTAGAPASAQHPLDELSAQSSSRGGKGGNRITCPAGTDRAGRKADNLADCSRGKKR